MFDAQERRRFLKPNILRRKTKAPVRRSVVPNVSSSIDSLTTKPNASAPLQGTTIDELQLQPITKFTCVKPLQSVQKDLVQNNVLYGQIETIDPKQSSQNIDNEGGLLVNIVKYNEENPVQPSVNVESFFSNGENRENLMVFTINPSKEIPSVVIIDEESHKEGLSVQPSNDLITNIVPVTAVSKPRVKAQVKEQIPTPTTVVSPQQLFENTTLASIKFKCDFPDCKKQFRSEKKYKWHKNSHNKSDGLRVPRPVTVECPVKKLGSDGTEQSCGKIYPVRGQLAKHLKQDHTPEDAAYRCAQCERHFFWESGLRAHARSHVQSPRARVPQTLACGWPGCGRVFSVPCRLREHARAHTGDKPYSCRFPNCNSSFRSASKLERHARRHTGLRRHACGACGRAFLRREHLRDHVARVHAHTKKRKHLICCPHEECEQTFKDADTLEEHINNTHSAEEEPTEPPAEQETGDSMLKDNLDFIFLVEESNDAQESEVKGEAEEDDEVEEVAEEVPEAEDDPLDSRSARTHCPWPLAERYQPANHYVLEEDNTVEQPEGSESNNYTVRSDLFLHGNVLINEDSVQMGSAVENAEVTTETSAPNDELGLGLLEHPHIDLMQEEMMFTTWQ